MKDIIQYTKDYNQEGFEEYQVEYRRKKILEIINRYPHARILEIGCGYAPLFSFLENDYEKYVVIEPSEDFFYHAQQLRNSDKIVCINDYFSVTDALKNESFDFIICSSLLHELDNPDNMLQDMKRIATGDTIVHINVPNAKSIHRLLAKEMGLLRHEWDMSERNILLQQSRVYDMASLLGLVHDNGFSVLESGSYFVKPFSHAQMYEMVKSQIISKEVLEGLYLLTNYIPEYGSEIYVNCKLNSSEEN